MPSSCRVISVTIPEDTADETLAALEQFLSKHRLEHRFKEELTRRGATGGTAHCMIGASSGIEETRRRIERLAQVSSTVLITGETGTGKELVAALIHEHGPRRDRPFVAINCSAIPDTLIESELLGHERGAFTGAVSRRKGLIEAADGGTLFLDEIGDMDLRAQTRLLRVIEHHQVTRLGGSETVPVDVRIIAATHRDLERMIADEQFREDLYYRLNVASIH